MRIVIDLEATQSPHSRNRGIGRYSMALAKAMLRHRGNHEFIVALNGMYADTVGPVRESLAGLLPSTDIVTWESTLPPLVATNPGERRAYELVRETFLASLKADVVHVASLFESGPYSFTSIGTGELPHRTAVTLYDLIPHVYPDIYLYREEAAREYGEKIEHLKRADLWLAISESSRREGIERLALPTDSVVNISTAADDHFTPGVVAPEAEVSLRVRYGLWRPFVMYTGGIDHRKNIEGLIEAWARLPMALRRSHQLAIVCSVQPPEQERLEQLAARVGLEAGEMVMTGFVPEDHLLDLYRLCKLFVFPSLHEGFGLPALEAMRCGAPVIGSNNSSIPEVIGRADALFDARSQAAITAKLQQCLFDDPFRLELARHGPQQAQRFSWDTSAKTALAAIEELGPRPRRSAPPSTRRQRLAYVSPLPPARSGIADYSAELLPALAAHYDIDVIIEQPTLDPLPTGSFAKQRSAAWFMAHGDEYDRILYHFGNSEFHVYMVPLLERHPGTVVLHDFFLSGLQAHRELVVSKQPHWTRALYDSHGWRALVARARASDMTGVIHEFPANFDVLRQAQGVIVHSPYSAQLAREWYGPGAADGWALIPHLRVALPLRREEARAQLGLASDDLLVCSFGILGPTKMNHRLLAAWQRSSLAGDPKCRLVFVGENHPGDYGKELSRAIGSSSGRVAISGWASPEVFRRYLNAGDLAVQLRTLSRGETSGTVLDAMNHGMPVIANANGAMAYLPREAAVVLDEDFTDEQLVEALEMLRRDRARRTAMGQAARRIIETQHAPADCATAYAEAIERFAARATRGDSARLVRQIAAVLPTTTSERVAANLANGIACSLPPPRPARQLLVDVSAWAHGAGDGSTELPPLLPSLLDNPVAGWRVEPVYLDQQGEWRYAREFTLRHYGCQPLLPDDPVEFGRADVWCRIGANDPGARIPQRAFEAGIESIDLPAQGQADFIWAWIAATRRIWRGSRLFVDISELVRHDWQSGIQRVVKNYLQELLRTSAADHTVVPVCATAKKRGYRIAGDFLLEMAGVPAEKADKQQDDAPEGEQDGDGPEYIRPEAGDIFFALDLQPLVIRRQEADFDEWRRRGVRIVFMVYDLLPVRLPDCFHPGAAEHHERWLRTVAKADVAICISESIAQELRAWLRDHRGGSEGVGPDVRAVHLGADIGSRIATRGLSEDAPAMLAAIRQHVSFLMVGTIEPRKSHAVVLAAFEQLWASGQDCNLVISGRPGWMVDELVEHLRSHPQRGLRLFWIENASDEFLEELYQASTALIAASRGEGFGLPLVEAAERGLPIIARDLPVFREVAGDHAYYFRDDGAHALAASLAAWIALYEQDQHPKPEGLRRLTWQASAAQVKRVLLDVGQPVASADVGHAALHLADQQGLVFG